MIQIDMPMPKCCDECFALDDNGDYPYCLISQDQRGYTFNVRESRMPSCPLKAQEPLQVKHIHEEYPEHSWKRNEYGKIDEFAYEVDYHNGPVCERCGDSFCKHCEPHGYETHRHCVVDKYLCPNCGKLLIEKVNYCSNCGQGVEWE